MKRIIALIPAKKTSVRVREKNLRDIGGWPLMQYSIEAAHYITDPELVFVSSEDDGILRSAVQMGAGSLKRPAELSLPHVKNIEVLADSFTQLQRRLSPAMPDYAVLLQPTHPFRLACDMDQAIRLINSYLQPKFVISVKPLRGKVGWMQKHGKEFSPLQKLEDAYGREKEKLVVNAGAFYFFHIPSFLEQKTLIGEGTVSVPLSNPDLEIDLDTESDFISAQALFNAYSECLDFKPNTLMRECI